MRIFLWAAAFSIAIGPADAAPGLMTGATLLKSCEGSATDQAACEGYLQGVSDTLDYVGETMPAANIRKRCVPPETKPEVLRRVFVKLGHLGLHNEQRASSLAMVGFTAAWACFGENDRYKDAFVILGKELRPELK